MISLILLTVGSTFFCFQMNGFLENSTFKIASKQTPSGELLKMTKGSFHGLGRNHLFDRIYGPNLTSGEFPLLLVCKSMNSHCGELGLGRLGEPADGHRGNLPRQPAGTCH